MKKHGKVYASTIDNLSESIKTLNNYFLRRTQQQVNTALTIRNWIIGFYMVEYELHGSDRAKYGTGIYKTLAERLLQNSRIFKRMPSLSNQRIIPRYFADTDRKILFDGFRSKKNYLPTLWTIFELFYNAPKAIDKNCCLTINTRIKMAI